MPYSQSFGLSRLSPLNNTEEVNTRANDIIENNNNNSNSSFNIGGMEYKTQSEWGMSDAEYAKHFKEDSIHDPMLDEVVVRPGVDYEKNPDFEENLKKNLSKSEYQRLMSGKPDPYKKDLLYKGTYGRSDYSSAGNIIPTPTADDVQAGLDYASLFDPTPISDGINLGISGARGAHAYATGDMEGAKRFGKKALASGFYMIPGTDMGKLGKLNKFGKSTGTTYKASKTGKYKTNMFIPESSNRNVTRGLTNFAFRKGYNTKATDFLKSKTGSLTGSVGSLLGKRNIGEQFGQKSAEFVSKNYLSGKQAVKQLTKDDDKAG